MKRHSWLLLSLVLLPLAAWATTITRSTKPNGTTAWVDGFANDLTAASLNADFDNIINVVNGNLDNTNIAAGAAIAWSKLATAGQVVDASVAAAANIQTSKIDDFSDNSTEFLTTFDAGLAALPTSLTQEIEALRFQVAMLNGSSNITGATNSLRWHQVPARTQNMLRNGDFEDSADGAITAAPSGWTFLDAGAAYSTDDTDQTEGLGHALLIDSDNDGVTNDGVTQTLAGLKRNTSYFIIGRAKAANSGICIVTTTGATTNAAWSSNATSYASFAEFFTTDSAATTTPVVINLAVTDDGAGDDRCSYDHVTVYESNGTNHQLPRYVPVYVTGTSTAGVEDAYATTLLIATVTVPGPNYVIKVMGTVCAGGGTVSSNQLNAEILENTVMVREGSSQFSTASVDLSGSEISLVVPFFRKPAVAGTTYTYELLAQDNGTGMSLSTAACGGVSATLLVELLQEG